MRRKQVLPLLALLLFGASLEAIPITFSTTQHATVSQSGAEADGDFARFATRRNYYGFDASFLVLDFDLNASVFGSSGIDDILSLSLMLTPKPVSFTIGRFDVFYVENSAPSIDSGSTDLVYDGVWSRGFNSGSPPPSLSGLTSIASGMTFDPSGPVTMDFALGPIKDSLLSKVNDSGTARFIISEAVDTTVASWYGLGDRPDLAPMLTIDAKSVPDGGSSIAMLSMALLLLLIQPFVARRKN